MSRRKRIRNIVVIALLVLLTACSQQLLWGKLFPYSPVKLGFAEHELANVIVYLQEGSTYAYKRIDDLIPVVEERHGLRFARKPEVLVFCDSSTYEERSTTRARYCAYPNGSLVVSPWAVEEAAAGKISMEIYLTHELSHILLYQHMGTINAYFCFPRWFLEGIAVYHSHQMGTSWYPSKSETYEYIRQGNFVPPKWFGTKREEEVGLTVPYPSTFAYCEFACIIDYLIDRFGRERFAEYQAELLDGHDSDSVFKEVYGLDFDAFTQDFRAHADHQVQNAI